VNLPQDYLDYVHGDGSDSGSTRGQPGFFQLWHPDELDRLNGDYQVSEHAPGFIGFGSDGGGEMLAFDAAGVVYKLPFIGMEPSVAIKIAASWSEVVQRIIRR
jgi:hypothetical protein